LTRFVMDASVSLSWFLDRPAAPYAISVREALARGARGVVPELWHLEMANGFVIAERRRHFSMAETQKCLADIEIVVAKAIDTEMQMFTVRDALDSARASLLTAYDAVYLELAQRLQLPLATIDRPLQKAALAAGVNLFPQI